MPELVRNKFSTYRLTTQEELLGAILTDNNKAVIQNIIAERAELKLSLLPDDPEFVKQSAFYAGQMEILEYLIANSNDKEAYYHKAPTSQVTDSEIPQYTMQDYLNGTEF